MKKKTVSIISFILIISTLFSGCQTKTSDSAEADSQNYWGFVGHDMAASEKGYYFFNTSSGMLYFYDRESGKTVPLCDKTDCNHEVGNKDCNAFFDTLLYMVTCGIWYYNHNLYVVGYEQTNSKTACLYCIAEDGSKRTKLCELYQTESDGTGIAMNIYQGYAYYSPQSPSMENTTYNFYRIALEENAKPEVIYSFDAYQGSYGRVKATNGKVYFQSNYQNGENDSPTGNIIEYDCKSGECETVLKDNYLDYAVTEETLYYNQNETVRKKNLSSGEDGVFFEMEGESAFYLSYDGNYLLADNDMGIGLTHSSDERRIYVLNMDGELEDTVEIGSSDTMLYGDEYRFFAWEFTSGGNAVKTFAKTDFGSGSVQWNTIYEPESNEGAE
jgi:hypothetical protein